MSGTGTSSRTSGLPYSCIRAAFMSASFPALVRWYLQPLLRTSFRAFLARMRASGWLRWAAKCGYCSLGNCNVLLNGSGARSNGTDDASVQHDGYAAAKDDNLASVTFLNTKQRLTRLRQAREIRGRLIEDPRRHRLIDGKVDAADECAILAYEGHQVAATIDHCNVVSDPQARGLRLSGG